MSLNLFRRFCADSDGLQGERSLQHLEVGRAVGPNVAGAPGIARAPEVMAGTFGERDALADSRIVEAAEGEDSGPA